MFHGIAWLVAVMNVGLSTGAFQFADGGCSHDAVHEALSHEHAATGTAQAHEDAAAADDEEHEDSCPPFCGDCQDCAGCFHPVAVAAAVLSLPSPAPLGRGMIPAPPLTLRPPSWAPPSLLHVPRA